MTNQLLFAATAASLFAAIASACGDPDSSSIVPQATPTGTVARSVIPTVDVITASVGTAVPSTPASGTPAPVPTPTPLPPMPANEVRLKYTIFDRFGTLWWCDPDFYPIARDDEQVLAEQRFAEIEADGPSFAAILEHLNFAAGATYTPAQKLAIYRDWKVLRALQLEPIAGGAHFNARFTRDEQTGVMVDGTIDAAGQITVRSQSAAEPPACPICLARGTRIATPDGEVPVEELRPGMTVWTAAVDGTRMPARVIKVGSSQAPPSHRIVHLMLADGRSLRASPSHPLADGRLLGDLRPGDPVDGSTVIAAELEPYTGAATYDLLPSGPTGTYWADNILVESTLVSAKP